MGLLQTRWEADYEGHRVVVTRNELGRGFSLEVDGAEIARRAWSWVGLGELHGTAELEGKRDVTPRTVAVKCVIEWAGFQELDGKCTITIDGHEIPVKHIR